MAVFILPVPTGRARQRGQSLITQYHMYDAEQTIWTAKRNCRGLRISTPFALAELLPDNCLYEIWCNGIAAGDGFNAGQAVVLALLYEYTHFSQVGPTTAVLCRRDFHPETVFSQHIVDRSQGDTSMLPSFPTCSPQTPSKNCRRPVTSGNQCLGCAFWKDKKMIFIWTVRIQVQQYRPPLVRNIEISS